MSSFSLRSPALRRAVLIVHWVGMFVLTHTPYIERFRPEHWRFKYEDRVAHFLLYAVWAWCWRGLLMASRGRVTRTDLAWIVAGGAAYGILDELTQPLVGRTAELADWLCDLAGLATATLLGGTAGAGPRRAGRR
mgnify:CR=1 FL=1